jgi:hypothetical protein
MRLLISSFIVLFSTFSTVAFSMEDNYDSYDPSLEEKTILHEMQIACVSSKKECKLKAREEGFSNFRAVSDLARCPQRPKTLACIVKH